MKCQILFSGGRGDPVFWGWGRNGGGVGGWRGRKNIINLSSAELVQTMVKVKRAKIFIIE